jgi:hypothetical protein
MVGGISDAHVKQDIVDAKAFGLDGFALNFGMHHIFFNGKTLKILRSVCIMVKRHGSLDVQVRGRPWWLQSLLLF